MQKTNYQAELDIILSNLKEQANRPSLLLHSCCGPCSSYCLSYLNDYFDITVFYYNPNIYTEEEYEHRLSEQKKIISCLNNDLKTDIKVICSAYDHHEFLEQIKGYEEEKEGGARCEQCFRLRLSKTKEFACLHNFDFFATTLTVSPHKNAILINEIGEEFAKHVPRDFTLNWLPSDFKKKDGYKTSIELSKRYNLYRQDYCGCEFAINHLI